MASKIPIPVYNPNKNYEIFKSELALWEAVTDLAKEKRGAAVALSLPDNEHCTLRSTVLQKVTNQTLTSEKGLSELTKTLDEILGKDDLEDWRSMRTLKIMDEQQRQLLNIFAYLKQNTLR